MPPVWTNRGGHYLDEALARAWIDRATHLTSAATEATVNDRDAVSQRSLVHEAWSAVGQAYQAMNLRATTEPAYLGAMRDAYGGGWRPGQGSVLLLRNDGSIPRVCLELARVVWSGAYPAEDWWTPVRAQFTSDNRRVSSCWATVADTACDRTYPDRWTVAGARCPYGTDDWRCFGTDAPWFQSRSILAPLLQSLRIARTLASVLRTQGPGAIVDAARAAGAQSVGAAGQAPTHAVAEPPDWRRPPAPITPIPVRPPAPDIPFGFTPGAHIPPIVTAPTPPSPAPAPGPTPAPGPAPGPAPMPPPATTPLPSLRLVTPTNGATVGASGAIDIVVEVAPASDGGELKQVVYLIDGAVVGVTYPPVLAWRQVGTAPGAHTVGAYVTDEFRRNSATATASVTVVAPAPGTIPPPGDNTTGGAPPPTGVPPGTPSCTLPIRAFQTQAEVDAWNAAHPQCPPVSLPGAPPGGRGAGWLWLLVLGGVGYWSYRQYNEG